MRGNHPNSLKNLSPHPSALIPYHFKIGHEPTYRPAKRQEPGKPWTFRNKRTGEEVSGILPLEGQSNDFAYFHSRRPDRKSTWTCAKFARDKMKRKYQVREGSRTFVNRMKYLLAAAARHAKNGGYTAPNATADELVLLWQRQRGKCAACGGILEGVYGDKKNTHTHLEHSHTTGEVRGFVHKHCNFAEAALLKMTDDEFFTFVEWAKKVHGRSSECRG